MVHDLALKDDGETLVRTEASFGKKLDSLKEGEKIFVVELTDVDGEETGIKKTVIE